MNGTNVLAPGRAMEILLIMNMKRLVSLMNHKLHPLVVARLLVERIMLHVILEIFLIIINSIYYKIIF